MKHLALALFLTSCALETEPLEPEATPYVAALNGLPQIPCSPEPRRCVRIKNKDLNTMFGNDPSTASPSINALRAAITVFTQNERPRFECVPGQPNGTAWCRDEINPTWRFSKITSTRDAGGCTRVARTGHTSAFSVVFSHDTEYCSPDKYRFTFPVCAQGLDHPAAHWPEGDQGSRPYLNVCWGNR